jgi:diguanylate cyclase (GGDEF)-like protein
LLEQGVTAPGAPDADTIVLVAGDARAAGWIGEMLAATWHRQLRLVPVEHPSEAARELADQPSAWVLLDLASFYADRIGLITQIRTAAPQVPIVVVVDHEDEDEGVAAIRAGAQDYLSKPGLYPAQLRRALLHAAERKRTESMLTHQALHDALTGLPNRALFEDRLGLALERSRRSGAAIAVLFLDLDNFKHVNDSLGHAAGDQVLTGLADRLRTMLRPMDTLCRYGGDEFTLLFEDLGSEREVVLIAERISQAAALPVPVDRGQTTVTVSIGVAMVRDPDIAPDAVLREADAAMYRAKRSGRSRFELFDESSRERAMRRLGLEAALRRAVEREELVIHYQPRFSLGERPTVEGLEALVRWRHPEHGLMPPPDFIPVAEDTGLIVPIGHYVLERALRQVGRWRRRLPELTMSVNVSGRQLEDMSLLSALSDAVHATAAPPQALCLEFPEPAIADLPDSAVRTMQGLKAMGVQLAVDDFGLGPSALPTLKRLPLDALKLHQSVLAGLGQSAEDEPIVAALVELGHALGLSVVAEGVERGDQLRALRALGCDGAQGFWLGRPVAEDQIEALLSTAAAPTNSTA